MGLEIHWIFIGGWLRRQSFQMVPLDDTIKDDIQTFEIIADDLLC